MNFGAFQGMIVAMEILIGAGPVRRLLHMVGGRGQHRDVPGLHVLGYVRVEPALVRLRRILCMGGLGRAFGMDYWSVPFFKRWWNGTKFARKRYFYADDPSK
jgi:NADH dehydrogenase